MSHKPWVCSMVLFAIIIVVVALPVSIHEPQPGYNHQQERYSTLSQEGIVHPDTGAKVVASVDNVPIYDTEIDRLFGPMKEKYVGKDRMVIYEVRLAIMNELVRRQVVLNYLQTTDYRATEQEIDLAFSEVKQTLKAQGRTLAEFLASGKADAAMLRRNLSWQIAWSRYLDKYMTDENLKRYYERHYAEFDGTERKVAHIFIQGPEDINDARAWDSKFRDLVLVRDQIYRGTLEFDDAVKTHSQAPSKDQGGLLGWIGYVGMLDQELHRAAFSKPVGQIAGPIRSSQGIHLLKILEEKRGERAWEKMRGKIRDAAMVYLFQHLADRNTTMANIQYFDEMESEFYGSKFGQRVNLEITSPSGFGNLRAEQPVTEP